MYTYIYTYMNVHVKMYTYIHTYIYVYVERIRCALANLKPLSSGPGPNEPVKARFWPFLEPFLR